MARTSEILSSAEIVAVEELNAIGNNRVPYKNNSGSYEGAALGVAGFVLTSNGTTSAPTFQAGGGGGGTATLVTVANEAADSTCFPMFGTAATGDLGPKSNAKLTFDSTSGALGASEVALGVASTTAGFIRLRNAGTSNELGIQSGTTTGSYVLTLPPAVASGGQTLVDAAGNGTLSWGTTNWTRVPGSPTRSSNTVFTVTDTANANLRDLLLGRGVQVRWLEASVEKRAAIVSATYAANVVTCTMVGDTMASIDSNSLKYYITQWTVVKFQYPGTTSVATNVASVFQADKAYRVYGAKAYLATAGTTGSSTYDINNNGTTMFTTKPSIASAATVGADQAANSGTSLASGDLVTVDIDSVSTTAGIGLTIDVYLGPSQISQQ